MLSPSLITQWYCDIGRQSVPLLKTLAFKGNSSLRVNPKLKKRLITRSPICGLLVEPQNVPFETWIWPKSMKNVKNRWKFHEKLAVFCHYLAMASYGSERSFVIMFSARDDGKSFMKIGCLEVRKLSYPPYFDHLSESSQPLYNPIYSWFWWFIQFVTKLGESLKKSLNTLNYPIRLGDRERFSTHTKIR